MLVLVAAARADIDGRVTVLSRSLSRRAGDASYCFYLVHFTVIGAGWRVLDATTATVPVVGTAFVVSAVGAWILHRAVERPLERALRGESRMPTIAVEEPAFSPAATAVA
jgi:peptidoglycan/LPS O-acetylase OafA/YrhL